MDWDFKVPLDLSVSVTFSTKPRASESDEHIINEEEIIDEYFKMGIRYDLETLEALRLVQEHSFVSNESEGEYTYQYVPLSYKNVSIGGGGPNSVYVVPSDPFLVDIGRSLVQFGSSISQDIAENKFTLVVSPVRY